jgi:hypothetical protein
MYPFEAFNKKHASDVNISLVAHQLVVAVVFWGSYLPLRDATSLLSVTIAAALVAHAVRIAQLSRFGDIVFTRLQIALVIAMLLAIAFLVSYACFAASRVTDASRLFQFVFLPLVLASMFSVHVDFLIARLFQRNPAAGRE